LQEGDDGEDRAGKAGIARCGHGCAPRSTSAGSTFYALPGIEVKDLARMSCG
jgi:hypothetical protein